ncbi:GH36-type glycosyl hydrolase domain-containing protein [Marinobacter caseinilyticus]|uniref:GH36-type glycosyl hydrolase domain-containing protein n=1 Tax=Marinobacter caseinilyticus TaxID=2692195 RepID=UPI00140996DF|nr:glucoamylase family protein [Marinobacter caseinilyticus]
MTQTPRAEWQAEGELDSAAWRSGSAAQPSVLDTVAPGSRSSFGPISEALTQYARDLRRIHKRLYALQRDPHAAGPWVDWYTDNEYLIRRVLHSLRRDLSVNFLKHLPVLTQGPACGQPRALELARMALEQCGQRFDHSFLEALVLEHRQPAPFNTAELWALPLLLRFQALRLILQTVQWRVKQLNTETPSHAMTDAEATDVVVNGVWSLHRLERTDWQGFFERTSQVENTLRDDPAGAYRRMDFETRDRYRNAVEKLARKTGCDELAVARAAIELAVVQVEEDTAAHYEAVRCHVGYYLIGPGQKHLHETLGYRSPRAALNASLWRHRQGLYLGLLGATAVLLVLFPSVYAMIFGSVWQAVLVAVIVSVPGLVIASVLVNWLITLTMAPRVLPKLDFAPGIDLEHRTAVCMAILVAGPQDVSRALGQLERHYLANTDPCLHFGLLTGLFDATHKITAEDEALLNQLRAGVNSLNAHYGGSESPFFWMHRQRTWAPHEGLWIEWERKRGKLKEFNNFILNGDLGTFSDGAGNRALLRQVRYVITLDADTQLPVNAARRLVGTFAHPLNQPVWDPTTGVIAAGYSILQPRVEINPLTATRNTFTRIFSGDRGLDLYTLAVSDAYQDVFGEGIFTGKGIYHVAAFEGSLRDAVPEGAVLSHDLFEGIHGRTALASDVVLYEDYPPDYLTYLRRLHRWVRGDWQLLPWLGSRVPTETGSRRANRLDAVHRWQLIHNLLRSLQSPWLLLLLVLGWFSLPGSALHWTILALLTLLVPTLTSVVGLAHSTLRRRRTASTWRNLVADIKRWLLAVAFLPLESRMVSDAIGRSLYRSHISHRRLLEWTPAAMDAGRNNNSSARHYWRSLWFGPGLAALVGSLLWVDASESFWFAAPVLALWLVSPHVAYRLRREYRPVVEVMRPEDRTHLRRLARRTWFFFESFVGPEDHWLPPDHYQENPKGLVAHRTSPTNIGLLLLANCTAYDLGYIDAEELLIRTRNTLHTLEKMPQFRGHILNWVDTHHLTPLSPAYVSTVDSGNLLGCLIALKQLLIHLRDEPVWKGDRFEGVLDAVGVLEDALGDDPSTSSRRLLAGELEELRRQVVAGRDQPGTWPRLLDAVAHRIDVSLDPAIQRVLRETEALPPEILADMRLWLERIHHHMRRLKEYRDRFLPWWHLIQRLPSPDPSELPDKRAGAWSALLSELTRSATFSELGTIEHRLQHLIGQLQPALDTPETELSQWLKQLSVQLSSASKASLQVLAWAEEGRALSDKLFANTDMSFLYNPVRHVFSIGYNVDLGKLDDNGYDLLASEARLASFLAIARGEVPARHWVCLGRPMTRDDGNALLLSWSGTMFEYLMPQLLMAEPPGSLLGRSARAAIDIQINFARSHDIPWGISESGYYLLDSAQNYAYHAFGVPQLALRVEKTFLELVVTPYATFLGLWWRPQAAMDNLKRLEGMGMLGHYGLYEALDCTKRRMEVGKTQAIVRSYMAHHQGMSLVSAGNVLVGAQAVARFSREPLVRATELLLLERVDPEAEVEFPASVLPEPGKSTGEEVPTIVPWGVPVDTVTPRGHWFSNGRMNVLATNTGGGFSSWKGFALTRWQPDRTVDTWGSWLYLQDIDTGQNWSLTRRPSRQPGLKEQVRFSGHGVDYRRQYQDLIQRLEVTVSPWEDVELRRVTLTNHGDRPRRLRLTTYAEVVLAELRADAQHPAFSKLFVHSEYLADRSLLLFERRARESVSEAPVMAELIMGAGGVLAPEALETDRAAFLGRLASYRHPKALDEEVAVSGALGYSLDTIAALQTTVTIAAGATVQVAFLRFAGTSREEVLDAAGHYTSWPRVQRVFEEARLEAGRELARANIDSPALRTIARLTSAVLYPHSRLRAPVQDLTANRLRQEHLWGVGVSGDYPIVLMTFGLDAGPEPLRMLLRAHAYWRKRHLPVDVVILNVGDYGYEGATRDTLRRLLIEQGAEPWIGGRGGIFPLKADTLDEKDVVLLKAAAAVVLDGAAPSLMADLSRMDITVAPLPRLRVWRPRKRAQDVPLARPQNLRYDNGYGGFTDDGKEYILEVTSQRPTPAPWINVIANPVFGFTVSEAGAGFSWFRNSAENRLTPWRNDPVLDEPGECLYLRDEETGALWGPTPKPVPHRSTYLVHHGAGYSRFEHRQYGIDSDILCFTPPDDAVKITRVHLKNRSSRPRRLTMTYYAEWVLGTRREVTQLFLKPFYLPEQHAVLVSNPYNPEGPDQVAFLATSREVHGYTTDRSEFIGCNGGLDAPAALARVGLASCVEPGRDTCGVLQVHVDLPAEGEETFTWLLGVGAVQAEALELIERFRATAAVDRAWDRNQRHWEHLLGRLSLECPDPGIGFLFNRWLLYQTVTSRLYGRTGLYQSSGAFGFRDQLQDTTALLQVTPAMCRERILDAAARQFAEGDVLHWWHPPRARGVRTRISDDLVWLPYVLCEYLTVTGGDDDLLDTQIPYLAGEPLHHHESERYAEYVPSGEVGSLYDHCLRAIQHAYRLGEHGLPLIGGGDWNDGMNRVGADGRGESVWLGWFLVLTMRRFADVCDRRADSGTAGALRSWAATLASEINARAWDGAWFRRAYYDNGVPMGAAGDMACEIDSIAQSWAVLSGAAEGTRGAQAMDAVWQRLFKVPPGQVLLFTPPFVGSHPDPGYIAAYPPGVRENGGQYTHAACWVGLAFAALGDAGRAAAVMNAINPIRHGDSGPAVAEYRTEPYAVAADIYGAAPHIGRGGWTWYTGSAGWMYRLILEGVLGIKRHGEMLEVNPCLPPEWPGCSLLYRYGDRDSVCRITITRMSAEMPPPEGTCAPCCIALEDDGGEQEVTVCVRP